MCFTKIIRIIFKKQMTEKNNKSNDEIPKGKCSLQMQIKCVEKIYTVSSLCLIFKIFSKINRCIVPIVLKKTCNIFGIFGL